MSLKQHPLEIILLGTHQAKLVQGDFTLGILETPNLPFNTITELLESTDPINLSFISSTKAVVSQGDFKWGEMKVEIEVWKDIIDGYNNVQRIISSPDMWDFNNSTTTNSGQDSEFPTGPGKPDPKPAPLPEPICHGPFCPGGMPFRSAQEIIDFIVGPVSNPGKEGIELKNGSKIMFSDHLVKVG